MMNLFKTAWPLRVLLVLLALVILFPPSAMTWKFTGNLAEDGSYGPSAGHEFLWTGHRQVDQPRYLGRMFFVSLAAFVVYCLSKREGKRC